MYVCMYVNEEAQNEPIKLGGTSYNLSYRPTSQFTNRYTNTPPPALSSVSPTFYMGRLASSHSWTFQVSCGTVRSHEHFPS